MPPKTDEELVLINAEEFGSREELEKKICSLMGLTSDIKPNYLISGKRSDLKKLFLKEGSIFWGIRCKETDPQPKEETVRINRGEIIKRKSKVVDIKNSIEQ